MYGDATGIGPPNGTGFRMAAAGHHINERLIGVAFFKKRLQVARTREARIERGMYPPYHRCEMWGENEPDGMSCHRVKTLRDFREVPVPGHAVRLEVVRRFGEQRMNFRFSPSPRNT